MMLGLQMPTEFQRKLSSQAKEFWKDLEAGGAGIGKFLEIFFHRQKQPLKEQQSFMAIGRITNSSHCSS